MDEWVQVIKVGAEGGSINLIGKKVSEHDWIFKRSFSEIFQLENEEDVDDIRQVRSIKASNNICKNNDIHGWEAAVELLNGLGWLRLYPIKVHEEFHNKVWKEVLNSGLSLYEADRWLERCFSIRKEIGWLSFWIKTSKNTVVLTGAGMSTESGLADFRSSKGRWRNLDPHLVASKDALINEYDLFHDFYSMRLQELEDKHPNVGHKILADWQDKGLIGPILTQNVDQFHQLAGSRQVYELHGTIRSHRCDLCEKETTVESFLNRECCHYCGGKIRPNVVLFGESLPAVAFDASVEALKAADLIIVIGTSLQVFPVNMLPRLCKGKKVYINQEISRESDFFDIKISGKVTEVLNEINILLA